MEPVRVDVRPILEETGGSFDIDDAFDLGVLRVGDNDFVLREPAPFRVAVTNAGAGIVVHGTISATVKAVCARCLCDFEDVIEGEVIGFYLRPGEDEPADEEEAEQAEAVDSEGSIDISPALTAALVVEAPFAPLHDDECAGLCPTCGANLNQGPCECHTAAADDHPFSSLRGMLEEDAPPHD